MGNKLIFYDVFSIVTSLKTTIYKIKIIYLKFVICEYAWKLTNYTEIWMDC